MRGTAIRLAVGLLVLVAFSGCRTSTRIKEVPRADLEVGKALGNRGYLLGTPPPPRALKTTRQIVETTLELGIDMKERKSTARGAAGEVERASDADWPKTVSDVESRPEAKVRYDTYTVRKGDSLWSIAAKSEVYGKATFWRQIYDANRDLLKSPEALRPGMKLKIPRHESKSEPKTVYSDEDIKFKK